MQNKGITCNWLDSGGRLASWGFSKLSCWVVRLLCKRRWARYEALVDLHQNALLNAKLFITPHLAPIIKPARALTCALNVADRVFVNTSRNSSPQHHDCIHSECNNHHSIFIPSTGLANEAILSTYLHSLIPDKLRPAREIGVSYGGQQSNHQ